MDRGDYNPGQARNFHRRRRRWIANPANRQRINAAGWRHLTTYRHRIAAQVQAMNRRLRFRRAMGPGNRYRSAFQQVRSSRLRSAAVARRQGRTEISENIRRNARACALARRLVMRRVRRTFGNDLANYIWSYTGFRRP